MVFDFINLQKIFIFSFFLIFLLIKYEIVDFTVYILIKFHIILLYYIVYIFMFY